ncbi:hypothetical protein RCL_jg15766.t1 [Rhizophagus clarus]|uniref:Uncharacterized protein n=1 Tax=Rhizophagus clarus TaxID=94130 RepID=A0A8H3MG37_9GLOM|nr:hypothetical protein RCL_jg15766.t1 [Rhizophagus clarus]
MPLLVPLFMVIIRIRKKAYQSYQSHHHWQKRFPPFVDNEEEIPPLDNVLLESLKMFHDPFHEFKLVKVNIWINITRRNY